MTRAVGEREDDSSDFLTVREILFFAIGFLRRRYLIVSSFLLLSLAVAGLYLVVTPPTYTASATMMIDPRKNESLPAIFTDAPADAAWIESQIGILRSAAVASYVVKKLGLDEDPEFTETDPGLLDHLSEFASGRLSWLFAFASDRLGGESEQSPPHAPSREALRKEEVRKEERLSYAIGAYLTGLDVRRINPSYLVRIEFHSRHPEQAAKIANSIPDAYAFEQLNARYLANQRASEWLQQRLEKLREQTAHAERAVIEFRAKHNFVAVDGRPMSNRQLAELNDQLTAARTQALETQARVGRIEAVLKQNQANITGNETVSDALNNAIITKLRTEYLELLNREADWSAKYGKNHAAVANLRKKMREIRRSILDELERILETHKSEYAIAKSREAQLEAQLSALVSRTQGSSQAEVTLRSLESTAQSYRKIYDDFLQRHTEAVQRQSFPVTEARLVSNASIHKSHPRTSFVWMVAILAGGMLGVGFGALRELLDNTFRTGLQVRSVLETECLAMIPLLKGSRSKALLPRRRFVHGREGARQIAHEATSVLRTVVSAPTSPFAEAIRSIKLTVDSEDATKRSKIIGLTSCMPDEGKSTVALSAAELIAQAGKRVLLIDLDFRNPTLSKTLAPEASGGLLDVLDRASSVTFADVVWADPTTGMEFLPTVRRRNSPMLPELFASGQAEPFFEGLRTRYEYVVVDLPPLAPMVDVRATSRLIDSYILVIEWGHTKIDAVKRGLSSSNARGVRDNIIGAVLNKVDVEKIKRYDSAAKYYYKTYGYSG
jgi:succinoglycan biosynthesis transport protein ExoP